MTKSCAHDSKTSTVKSIVLIGGGHAHALVIKQWREQPLAGVSLTLISNTQETPYSGMLPGLISGHYSFADTHINLNELCKWAKVTFICASVINIDRKKQYIHLADKEPVSYDIASINTGSTPNTKDTEGAQHFAVAVKPIANFYPKWLTLKQKIANSKRPLNIALVGAGAGGFELITAMQYASHSACSDTSAIKHQFHWVISGNTVLPSFSKSVQRKALEYCKSKGIKLHFDFPVAKVTRDKLYSDKASAPLSFDELIWCAAAMPATWPASAGLSVDDKGFIQVNEQLQTLSDKNIFAVGDIATQVKHPRAKAGVFAVRQAPVLLQNLRRAAQQKPLVSYIPQQTFLSILATGDKQAIATRANITLSGKWLWQLKNYIDKKFMSLFKP